ncbi:MAG: AsmA-like C-terminal region-containing protein [Elusimicrobiota bacterium]
MRAATSPRLRAALGLTVLLVACGAARYLHNLADDLRPRLEGAASKYLRRRLLIENLEWRVLPSPALIGRDVRLLETDGSVLASSPEIVLDVALLRMLYGSFEIERMTILQLRTHLIRRSDGRFPLAQMVKEAAQEDANAGSAPSGVGFKFRRIELRKATLRLWKDDAPRRQTALQADGFILLGGSVPFRLSGELRRNEFRSGLTLTGAFRPGLTVRAQSAELPLEALDEFAPAGKGWTGNIAAAARLRRRDAGLRWDVSGTVADLRPPGAFAALKMRGDFRVSSHSTSTLKLAASQPGMRGTARATWRARKARLEWDIPEIQLEDITRAAGWPAIASGTASGTGRWEGQLDELPALRGSGRADISLRDFSFTNGTSSTSAIPQLRARIEWKPQAPWRIDLQAGDAWKLQALAHTVSTRSLTAEIEGKMLDLERLHDWMRLLREIPDGLAGDDWAVDAQAKFLQARFRETPLEELALKLEKRPEIVRISGLRARGMGGSLAADIELSTREPASYDIRWSTEGMDIEKLMRSSGAKYMISGVGHTRGRLRGPLDQPQWRHAAGTIDIEVKDGKIWQAPALVQVLSALSVTSVLRRMGRKSELGLPFRSGRAQIELGGGKAVIRTPAHIENPAFKLAFIGSYDLSDETIDGRFVIHFLTVLDEVIRAVPGVRKILLNNRMGLVPIWVEVRGPRQNPKVTVLSARSISDAFWRPVSDLFRLPLDLIKKAK